MSKTSIKAGIVTVFYHPSNESIDIFISFANHGYSVVIYNNGMDTDHYKKLINSNIKIIGDGQNIGLSSGLNLALNSLWKEKHIEGAILFDQDSKPKISLPDQLHQSFIKIKSKEKIACIGPLIKDLKKTKIEKIITDDSYEEVDGLATSGSYIDKQIFYKIGPFMDTLFIDCIDHEWCFRAKSMGYKIYRDISCYMLHDMGEIGVNLMGRYKPGYSSPTRHYYIVRNTIVLMKLSYVPFVWKCKEFLKTIRRIIFYILVSKKRVQSLKNIIYAIFDGINGKTGKLQNSL